MRRTLKVRNRIDVVAIRDRSTGNPDPNTSGYGDGSGETQDALDIMKRHEEK